MRRAVKGLIAAIVVVVLAAIAFIGWYVFGSRVPAKPKLGCGTAASGGPATPSGTWHVVRAENVYVGYRIHEVFGDALLERDAVGRARAVSGTLAIEGSRVTTAAVDADMTQLGSDRAARDAYVRDTTLETDRFPNARFTLAAPIALPSPIAKATRIHVPAARGKLLLHGVTRPITFDLNACWIGPTISVVGTAPVVLGDYGIEPPHTVIADVEDHGSVELRLTFAPGGR